MEREIHTLIILNSKKKKEIKQVKRGEKENEGGNISSTLTYITKSTL